VTTPRLDPARTALLVMDYQAGILGRLPGADALVERAAGAVASVRRAGGTVGYVRVAFTEADLAALPANSPMAVRVAGSGSAMHDDSPLTQVDERVAPEPGDVVVRKTRIGAFSTTDLDARLRGRGIDTLLLAGISTSGVVLSTVRDAADRDYRLVVVSDLCADPDEEVHAFLVERIYPRQADVVTASELADALGGS
jgi:nicotinamidase-related amidase